MRLNRLTAGVLLMLVSAAGTSAQELTERGTFKGFKFKVRAELSPDGTILAAGGGWMTEGELKLWDVATGKELASLPGYTDFLESLAFSMDGKRLVSRSHNLVQVWDVSAHKEIAYSRMGIAAGVTAFNRDGTRVAAVDWHTVKVWEVDSRKELVSFSYHVPRDGGTGATFSRDLATLAASNFQEIDLWDVATGKLKATLSEHRSEVGRMVWSADDKTLIASSTCHYGKEHKWPGRRETVGCWLWQRACRPSRTVWQNHGNGPQSGRKDTRLAGYTRTASGIRFEAGGHQHRRPASRPGSTGLYLPLIALHHGR